MHLKFKIILLFFLIYFQILYSNDIFLSKRSGEYYDNFGRKLILKIYQAFILKNYFLYLSNNSIKSFFLFLAAIL